MSVAQVFENLISKLDAQKSGNEYKAVCPVHQGKSQSLTLSLKGGKILLKCWKKPPCPVDSIVSILGITMRDLFENDAHPNVAAKPQRSKIIDVYKYVAEDGASLFEVVRKSDKTFPQRRLGPDGKWIWDMDTVRRVLYRLPALKNATDVFVVEGEKDVHSLEALGYVATTAPMGAKAPWLPQYSEALRGKNVTILPDNDVDGISHGQKIAKALHLISASTKIVMVPMGKDITEGLERGLTKDKLEALAAAAPIFNPDAPTPDPEPAKDWRALFHTFAEFESAPPLSFLIEGFLQAQGINGLAALAESGKTWMALSVAKALLFGPGKLWDLFKVNRRAERVLYLIPESSLIPIKHRVRLLGLYEEIEKRLFIRTISKGDTPELTDPLLLEAVSGADLLILDTSVRFMGRVADDSSAMSVAAGLSNDLLKLMRTCPGAILILYHSQKGFRHDVDMNLESVIRGSGELGAVLATCWAVKQIDKVSNTLHVQNVKARDFEACGPFQLAGRPHIDREGDFRLYKRPEDCGTLQEESPQVASNDKRNDVREDRIAMVRSWMNEDQNVCIPELQAKFEALGISVKADTVRRYRMNVRKA